MEQLTTKSPLSAKAFAALGLNEVFYARPTRLEGIAVYAICAADGTELALAPDRAQALDFAREHGVDLAMLN